jgi:hypothetical protein
LLNLTAGKSRVALVCSGTEASANMMTIAVALNTKIFHPVDINSGVINPNLNSTMMLALENFLF